MTGGSARARSPRESADRHSGTTGWSPPRRTGSDQVVQRRRPGPIAENKNRGLPGDGQPRQPKVRQGRDPLGETGTHPRAVDEQAGGDQPSQDVGDEDHLGSRLVRTNWPDGHRSMGMAMGGGASRERAVQQWLDHDQQRPEQQQPLRGRLRKSSAQSTRRQREHSDRDGEERERRRERGPLSTRDEVCREREPDTGGAVLKTGDRRADPAAARGIEAAPVRVMDLAWLRIVNHVSKPANSSPLLLLDRARAGLRRE